MDLLRFLLSLLCPLGPKTSHSDHSKASQSEQAESLFPSTKTSSSPHSIDNSDEMGCTFTVNSRPDCLHPSAMSQKQAIVGLNFWNSDTPEGNRRVFMLQGEKTAASGHDAGSYHR